MIRLPINRKLGDAEILRIMNAEPSSGKEVGY
jgi:hypothetical protein